MHGNLRVSSIFATESGEWKLTGFEVLSSLKEEDPAIYVGLDLRSVLSLWVLIFWLEIWWASSRFISICLTRDCGRWLGGLKRVCGRQAAPIRQDSGS